MPTYSFMVRLGLIKKVTFNKILERGKGGSGEAIWQKSISGKGKSRCKIQCVSTRGLCEGQPRRCGAGVRVSEQ